MIKYLFNISLALACLFAVEPLFSQTELAPWGNITGIRIDGQLMEFESNLSVVAKSWSAIKATGKEKQRPKYTRKENQQVVTTNIDSLYFTEEVTDVGTGSASVSVQLNAHADVPVAGVYFCVSLPQAYYAGGTIQPDHLKPVKLSEPAASLDQSLRAPAGSVTFFSHDRQLVITFDKPTNIIIKKGGRSGSGIQVYMPVQTGDVQTGQSVTKTFTIKASGRIDKSPVILVLNTTKAGRTFDGLGGNFRLQNPRTDPQVIDYCLANLRVAWGRVEMPWRFWQPAIDTNPVAQAKAGKLHPTVQKAMQMAQRLNKLGMPVILTAWSAPSWAIVGAPKFRPGPDGVWGNPIDQSKANAIYASIADYITYVKEQYGFEIALFSFNESDLGINIRQTGEEHAALIKGLGAFLVSRGIQTKLLLGDNSDATTCSFIYPAMNDAATHPYIGAVSFHSWRGWETETLQKWADAATKLHLPLLVGEGSADAQAYAYPAIFQEQTYALEEINLYVRLLAICQPASILQWQLTADYSPLAGGGIFGDNGALRPIQRFWNLKQLSSTPQGLQAMPVSVNGANISAAALGNNGKGVYAIHLVNNGTTRQVTLSGLPAAIKSLRILITDKKRPMEEGTAIPVVNGKATFILNETSFTTLLSK